MILVENECYTPVTIETTKCRANIFAQAATELINPWKDIVWWNTHITVLQVVTYNLDRK